MRPVSRAPGLISAGWRRRMRMLTPVGPAEVALEHQQAAIRQAGRVGDVEAVDVAQLQAMRRAVRPRSIRCDSRCPA